MAELASPAEVLTALERLPEGARTQVVARIPTPSDDEIRRLYRIAEGLHSSGVYKDVKQAGMAFAKIIVGRDLGLTPARAMAGLHFVEGQVQIHYRTLGAFVRENGYEFRFGTGNPVKARTLAVAEGVTPTEVAAILEDGISQCGCAYWPIEPTNESVTLAFFGQRDPRSGRRAWLGDSTFTQEDAATAGLDRPRGNAPSNYVKFPRNMLTARAMSNGVGWYCPDALGGIPVYVEDEIQPRMDLTSGEGTGAAAELELSPRIEALMAEAAALPEEVKTTETRAVANRAYVVATLGKAGPHMWRKWETWAADQIAAAKAGAKGSPEEEPVPEPCDGEVDGVVDDPEYVEVPEAVQVLMDTRDRLREEHLAVLDAAAKDGDRALTDAERERMEEIERDLEEVEAKLDSDPDIEF